jgi:hypothetical protein
MIAQNINSRRREATLILPSLGPGIFGCMDTQLHANIVATQLQMVFEVDLEMQLVEGSTPSALVVLQKVYSARGAANAARCKTHSRASKKIMRMETVWYPRLCSPYMQGGI